MFPKECLCLALAGEEIKNTANSRADTSVCPYNKKNNKTQNNEM